jgi:octanoyl-[GcvH]:protein N-octanoyltransferase
MNSITTRLVTARVAGDPVLDAALSTALLEQVVAGAPAVVRVSRPEPMVSFGRLDKLAGGFAEAVSIARRHGYTPVMRVGGGRAHAVHAGVVEIGVAAPVRESTTDRFVAMAERLRAVIGGLGVVAEVGQLPGEFCPGAWSLHAGGVKLAGIAQRVTRGAAFTEAFLMVSGGERSREVLVPVYEALGVELDPSTVGDLGVPVEDALAAVLDSFAPWAPYEPDPRIGRRWRDRHEPSAGPAGLAPPADHHRQPLARPEGGRLADLQAEAGHALEPEALGDRLGDHPDLELPEAHPQADP